jgi:hypothetical protein
MEDVAFQGLGEEKKTIGLRIFGRRDPGGLDVENPQSRQ